MPGENRCPDRRRTGRSIASLALGCALAWLLVPPAALAQGAESPEALVAAIQKAAADQDIPAFIQLVAPSQLQKLAFQTDFGADMIADSSEDASKKPLEEKIAKLREKYGVSLDKAAGQPKLQVDSNTPQEAIDQHLRERIHLIYDGVDVAGYTGELTALVMTAPEMAGRSILPQGTPGDIERDGDAAKVKIGDTEVRMVREDGRWYVSEPGS
jgi:nucleotide-binding universal stress UspA family protein